MVNKERLAQNTEKRQSEKWRNRRNCSRNRVDKIIGALNYEEKIQPGKEKADVVHACRMKPFQQAERTGNTAPENSEEEEEDKG